MALPQSTVSLINTESPNAPTGSGINSPNLSPSGKTARQRSITDALQIFNIIGDLQEARKEQNEKNGRIQAKVNSERPYDDKKLDAEGLGYKSNFSTKPLATTISKVAARLTKAVQAARYLTSAELPDDVPDAKKKTEMFRREFTRVVRKWPSWYNFLNETSTETSTFGWTTHVWLDTDTWKPTHFRQDKAFLPDGTKHNVDSVQFAAFLQYVMPHELAALIRGENGSESDLDAARTAGWNIKETVDAINNAKPIPIAGTNQTSPYTDFRMYEDALRESSIATSMQRGAKQVMLWHVLVTEINGKVSHYIGDGNAKTILFEKEDRYDAIEDALQLLSYEQANGLLMASKGIGREVYELAGIVDRSRNETVDRLQMSGKIILTMPENKIKRFMLTVVGNTVLLPEGTQVAQQKIESGITEFLALDNLLTQLLDQIAGGVTPRTFERERVTKAEVNLYASREEEKRDDIETRYVTQLGSSLTTMQKRMYAPGCPDKDAKESRTRLLNTLSKEELDYLRDQPTLRTIEDFTQEEAQKIVLLAQETRNDPLYNHKEMERRKLTVLFSAEFAEAVLLPDNDPTETAEQAREQLMENLILAKGVPVPVSPRDNHLIHIQVLKQTSTAIAEKAGGGDPEALGILTNIVKHWSDHFNELANSGIDKNTLAEMKKELTGVAKHIGELQAQQQQAAQSGQTPDAAPAGEQLAAAPSPDLAPAPVAPSA